MKLEKELDIYIDHHHTHDPTVSTPKLSLYSLPSKPLTPPGRPTPPLHTTVASIPFQWEEAPGKPRVPTMNIININDPTSTTALPSHYCKSKAARCLNLPPRLTLTDQQISGKITGVPSPTTVLDGPADQDLEEDNDQERRSNLSHTMSFSSYGGDHQEDKVGGGGGSRSALTMRSSRRKSFSFSSWRWGSFRDNRKASVGSFDFSSSTHGGGRSGSFEDDDSKKAKIAKRVRRRSSFLSFSNNSKLVASMYGSIKQALPWRRRS